MPRTSEAKNTHYHFSVNVDNVMTYCRTIKDVASLLNVGSATIIRKLKKPEIVLRKYKYKELNITRCKIPIYERREITY